MDILNRIKLIENIKNSIVSTIYLIVLFTFSIFKINNICF